jgi:hypothetical protein
VRLGIAWQGFQQAKPFVPTYLDYKDQLSDLLLPEEAAIAELNWTTFRNPDCLIL